MRKYISTITTGICIIGLVGCGANNNTDTKITKNQSIEQKQNKNKNNSTSSSESEELIKIDLTKENKIITAKTEEDIYNGLYEAVKIGSSIVNFDISNYDNTNIGSLDIYKDTKYVIENINYSLVYDHPELNVVERMESSLDEKNNLVSVRMYYYYFKDNKTIFMPQDSKVVAAMLNKRVIKKGDKASIELLGDNAEKYDIEYIPKDNNIININENGTVDTLKVGETDINLKIISKKDNSKIYSGTLKMKVLPEDTIEIANVRELRKAITEKIGEDSVSIFAENIDGDIIYEGLQSIVSPYVFFITNNDYTTINIQYNEDEKNKALSAIKEINKKADEIINKIITEDMTDEKKVEAVYDYIINNADYDMEYYSNNGKVDFKSRTAYGILLDEKGICGGFADSINILLRKAGIESYTVSGNAGGDGHAWNVIKLNDEYRYLDATFDNTYSTEEKISHKYLNISEEEMSKDHEWYKERFSKFLKALEESK